MHYEIDKVELFKTHGDLLESKRRIDLGFLKD
jgi:hypothetical protein